LRILRYDTIEYLRADDRFRTSSVLVDCVERFLVDYVEAFLNLLPEVQQSITPLLGRRIALVPCLGSDVGHSGTFIRCPARKPI
jgi:hypothetical protein